MTQPEGNGLSQRETSERVGKREARARRVAESGSGMSAWCNRIPDPFSAPPHGVSTIYHVRMSEWLEFEYQEVHRKPAHTYDKCHVLSYDVRRLVTPHGQWQLHGVRGRGEHRPGWKRVAS